MTTVIEFYGLIKSGMYREDETPEEGIYGVTKALCCANDICSEPNKRMLRGGIAYYADLVITVEHDVLVGGISFCDLGVILAHFCNSLIIRKGETDEELFYYNSAN